MGLDLTIRIYTDLGTDELGRYIFKVTQLANLRNCWVTLNELDNRLDGEFSNCATHTFYGETFHEILKELQEELDELSESAETSEYVERKRNSREYNIKKLKEFIEANNVPNDDTQDYQVHAWW